MSVLILNGPVYSVYYKCLGHPSQDLLDAVGRICLPSGRLDELNIKPIVENAPKTVVRYMNVYSKGTTGTEYRTKTECDVYSGASIENPRIGILTITVTNDEEVTSSFEKRKC